MAHCKRGTSFTNLSIHAFLHCFFPSSFSFDFVDQDSLTLCIIVCEKCGGGSQVGVGHGTPGDNRSCEQGEGV